MPQRRQRGSGSIQVLPSGRYRARWRDMDDNLCSETFTHRLDADKFLRQTIAEVERTRLLPPAPPPPPEARTLDMVIDEWAEVIERSVKPRTVERYEDHADVIRLHLGDTKIDELTTKRLQAFVSTIQRSYAPKTVRATYAVLILVLGHAHRMGDVNSMPPKIILPKVSKPKLTIPTREEVNRLAAASDKRLWAPVILAGYCGLREGELLALHRADVHLDPEKVGDSVVPPHVFVHHARNKTSGAFESTKTEGVRRVYLPQVVNRALAWHLAEYPGELLVPVSASVVQKSWQLARHQCGLDRVRFHDLRHAAASIMIAAGLSVKEVSEQLGHANATQTLDTYLHLWPHSWDGAMRRLDEYLAG